MLFIVGKFMDFWPTRNLAWDSLEYAMATHNRRHLNEVIENDRLNSTSTDTRPGAVRRGAD